MNKLLLLVIAALLSSVNLYGQAPEAFKYQTVVRDGSGNIIAGQAINIKIGILQSSPLGTKVYSETFSPVSDSYGLVSLAIGTGNPEAGEFETIDWSAGPYFIEVAYNLDEGMDYTILGTSQLMSVPYALHAKTAENIFSGDYNDLSNAPDLSVYMTDPDDADADPANEIQVLSISHDTIFLSNGGFVKLPEDQVDDADADSTNEKIQSATLNGTIIEIREGSETFSIDLLPLFSEAYNTGFSEREAAGYTDGYNDGYDYGLAEGETYGYNDGYEDGEAITYQSGYDHGYNQAYIDGEVEGYTEGYTIGEEAGYTDGYNDGYDYGSGN